MYDKYLMMIPRFELGMMMATTYCGCSEQAVGLLWVGLRRGGGGGILFERGVVHHCS
jgi:hypothetical protein